MEINTMVVPHRLRHNLLGATFAPDDLIVRGLVDEVVDPGMIKRAGRGWRKRSPRSPPAFALTRSVETQASPSTRGAGRSIDERSSSSGAQMKRWRACAIRVTPKELTIGATGNPAHPFWPLARPDGRS